jgi:hypothetical protein
MDSAGIAAGIIAAIITTPFIVVFTFYFNKKYDYYQSLYSLIEEIEFNFKEMRKFKQNLSKIPQERSWLPKAVSTKVANLVQKSQSLHQGQMEYPITERAYLYNYLPDDAYVLFVNRGYHYNIQNRRSIIESIKHCCNTLNSDYYGKQTVKGGPFAHISKFYLYCNNFNFESQSLEEAGNRGADMDALFEEYSKKICTEYNDIGIENLKNDRYFFIVITFAAIVLALYGLLLAVFFLG